MIPGLDSIEVRDGAIEIGATSTHRSIERSALVQQNQPVLAELESQVANVRVRATGTLGGNLCFAEPHSDPATLLLVLGGTVSSRERATGCGGALAAKFLSEKLIAGAYANNLQPGEILTKISFPARSRITAPRYMKFQVHERPTLGLGLWLETSDDGRTFTAARVAVGCVCPFPSARPRPKSFSPGLARRSRSGCPKPPRIADAADLVDDHEGSAEYKRHLIGVFLRRTFAKAVAGDSL